MAALTALSLILGADGYRDAYAGACLSAKCTCDDDCAGMGFVCGDYAPGEKRCCGPPVKGTPCARPADGGAQAGDGGSGSNKDDDGCSLGPMGSQRRPLAAPLAAVALVWLVTAVRRHRGRRPR
jgi:hypothetical protein